MDLEIMGISSGLGHRRKCCVREHGTRGIVAWSELRTREAGSKGVDLTGDCAGYGELSGREDGTERLTASLAHAGTVVDNLDYKNECAHSGRGLEGTLTSAATSSSMLSY